MIMPRDVGLRQPQLLGSGDRQFSGGGSQWAGRWDTRGVRTRVEVVVVVLVLVLVLSGVRRKGRLVGIRGGGGAGGGC